MTLFGWKFDKQKKCIKPLCKVELGLLNEKTTKIASVPDGSSIYLAQECERKIILYKEGTLYKLPKKT